MDVFTGLSWDELVLVTVRLTAAFALGALVGWERQRHKRAAGLRTHILVAMGCATFTLLGLELAQGNAGSDASSRIVQGVATGIGFLGAGTILKLESEQRIKGLTTAAGVWATAALGVAAGAGRLILAVVLALLTLVTLALLRKFEQDEHD
jgi:putative Mg2+ transporter-C (MgtC) family protein